MAMTDAELDTVITEARAHEDGEGLPALIAARDRLQVERDAHDPAIGRVWDAVVDVADRVDDIPQVLALSEGRARWLAAVRGPADPDVIRAWRTIADIADDENAWDAATRAWRAIASAPIAGADRASLLSISLALRGLAGRALADDEDGSGVAEARTLAERDLAVTEALWPDGHAQVALSLDNLAHITARLGDRAAARRYRERQRDVLVKLGGSASQLAKLEAQLAELA